MRQERRARRMSRSAWLDLATTVLDARMLGMSEGWPRAPCSGEWPRTLADAAGVSGAWGGGGGPLLHRAERDEDGGAFERDLGLGHLLFELELLQAGVPGGAVGVEELRDGERACLVRDLGA